MKLIYTFIPALLLFVCSFSAFSQGRINIENAESLVGGKTAEGEAYQILIGNVILQQGTTRIFGDSVILFRQRNFTEVFGERVRVEEGDSITVIGDRLVYDGTRKVAEMRNDVVYTDPTMRLYTDHLNYNLLDSLAFYYEGGRLVDSANVLESQQGSYHTVAHLAAFKDSVVMTTPDYVMESDTLEYNTVSKIAYTRGPTLITLNDGTVLNAEAGSEFDTNAQQSIFQISTVETDDYIISADQLFLDDFRKLYRATSNVQMLSKTNDVIITGDSAIHLMNDGITKVFGKPVMKKVMELDTLYLSADTLVSLEDSIPSKERILAYHDVRIFRQDMQAIADSLSYHITDSILYFYDGPVIWNGGSQIVADSINFQIIGGQMRRMNATDNSFVISKDTISNYNQVKGRKMVAWFDQGQLASIDVSGNSESIYFALEADTLLVGMNKIIGSDLKIKFDSNEVKDIHVYVKPQADFIPPHEITDEKKYLKDFEWRIEERPSLVQVLERTPLNKPKTEAGESTAEEPLPAEFSNNEYNSKINPPPPE
ncbi:MAG: OstA-like protein [Cyclobacteriaceae bacterium]